MRDAFAEWGWESDRASAQVLRALMTPLEWAFAAGVGARNLAYDRGLLLSEAPSLPSIAVGNLTVGGAGKTPIAAWLVSRLRDAGAAPAVVMRGYGADEIEVHRHLNTGIPVIADPDRVRGIGAARAAGATVAVLDDAFQHRRVRRDADVLVISADQPLGGRLLPAGRWREPLSSASRATHLMVTRKRASADAARATLEGAWRAAPAAKGAIAHLSADAIVEWGSSRVTPLSGLRDCDVLAVSGIADPASFVAQLQAAGARVTPVTFGDHHAFSADDASRIARQAGSKVRVVCTLKDAVKLGALWPAGGPPIGYLSQRVTLESGEDVYTQLIDRFARPPRT